MTNIFLGLEIAKRGIMVHQTSLNITGHNISNVNTEGYSRQIGNIITNSPWHAPIMTGGSRVGQIGTGSDMLTIMRMRDAFIDAQMRNELRATGYWNYTYQGLSQIESIINEPSEDGLRGALDEFWSAWQNFTVNAENSAERTALAQKGMAVSDTFRHMYSQFRALQSDLNDTVKIKVDEINVLATSIADLNYQIKVVETSGKQPNDLYDRRDLLIDQLSTIIDAKVYFDEGGNLSIQCGGRTLVQGVDTSKLMVKTDHEGMHMVAWADTGQRTLIRSGDLKGILDLRGKTSLDAEANVHDYKGTIPDLINKLNSMAQTIVETVNSLHRGGYSLNNKTTIPDGTDFFKIPASGQDEVTNWAQYIIVDEAIIESPNLIAASQYPTWDMNGNKSNYGDNRVALAIAQLKHNMNNTTNQTFVSNSSYTTAQFPITIAGSLEYTVTFNGATPDVTVSVPAGDYNSLAELAEAVQKALQTDADLIAAGVVISVRCEGNQLIFQSDQPQVIGMLEGNDVLSSPDYVTTRAPREFSSNIGAGMAFPDGGGQIYTVTYGGVDYPVTVPLGTYNNIADYALAVDTAIQADPVLSSLITVTLQGNQIIFTANDSAVTRITEDADGAGGAAPAALGNSFAGGNRSFVSNATVDDYWRSLAAKVGVDGQEARRMLENQQALINELENKRQSTQGVNIDEEMANMVKFQHAYNASARFMTTIDEELNVIINQMGLVGRG